MSTLKRLFKPYRVVMPYVLKNSQTVKYPTERLIFAPGFRGRHRLYPDRCIHCGTCVRVCPCNSISLVDMVGHDGKYPQINYGTCSLCGYCVEFCPKSALEHTDLVEYSTEDRKDLLYTPEKLSVVPPLGSIMPQIRRRIRPVLEKGQMKYVEVQEK